jgi:hypothetical protein
VTAWPPWVTAVWPYVIVLLGPIGAGRADAPFVPTAYLVNALLVPLAFAIATGVHELGHAVVARLVGGRVLRVQIGRGRRLASFTVAGMPIQIGLDLAGGLTWIDPARSPLARLRTWLWTLGGPAATLGLLLALIWLAHPEHAARWALGDGLLGRVAPLQVLALVSAVQLVHLALSASEGSDLARLLTIPFQRGGRELERAAAVNTRAWRLAVSGKPDAIREAVRLARPLHQDHPHTPWIAGTYGTALVAAGHLDLGLRLLREAYDDNLDDRLRAHNAAWLAIAEARRGRPDDAARWRSEAERLDPSCSSLGHADADGR